MATFFIALLCVSIVGLIVLISLKRWEMHTGRVVLGSARPRASRALGEALYFAESGVPELVRRAIRKTYALIRLLAKRFIAWSVLHAERVLERSLRAVRGATQPAGEGEVSDFLREVAEHKKSLLKKSTKSRAIYEE
jgi:hypothetical protein